MVLCLSAGGACSSSVVGDHNPREFTQSDGLKRARRLDSFSSFERNTRDERKTGTTTVTRCLSCVSMRSHVDVIVHFDPVGSLHAATDCIVTVNGKKTE